MSNKKYVHGYLVRENQRLVDQASTLAELLHADTEFPPGSNILEAGCGVGAQTIAVARNNPLSRIQSVDISASSLKAAKERSEGAGITRFSKPWLSCKYRVGRSRFAGRSSRYYRLRIWIEMTVLGPQRRCAAVQQVVGH
jgi:hypothetical protein